MKLAACNQRVHAVVAELSMERQTSNSMMFNGKYYEHMKQMTKISCLRINNKQKLNK